MYSVSDTMEFIFHGNLDSCGHPLSWAPKLNSRRREGGTNGVAFTVLLFVCSNGESTLLTEAGLKCMVYVSENKRWVPFLHMYHRERNL